MVVKLKFTKRQQRYMKPKSFKLRPTFKKMSPSLIADQSVRATSEFKHMVSKPLKWATDSGTLPRRVIMKMRYDDAYITRAPALPADTYVFAINSIYDPDSTGTGHQPDLHDTMANLFQRYRVHAISGKVFIQNTTATADVVAGISLSDGGIGTALTADQIRRTCAVSALLAKNDDPVASKCQFVIPYTSIKKRIVGEIYDDSSYSAGFGSNPTNIVGLNISVADKADSTNVTYNIGIELVYYVECVQRDLDRATD